jgi:hypothetical protein
MRYRIALIVLVALMGISACNLSSSGGSAQNVPTPTGPTSGNPVVTILSPQDGAQVPINQQILVSANANDPVGITRVQLFANGQIAKTVSSQSPGGDSNLNVLLDYTPTATGTLTMQVIAYRGALASNPAQITVTVQGAQVPTQKPLNTQPPVINVPPINPYDPTCRVLVNTPLNFRTGPSVVYDRISLLATGTVAPITGRLGDNSWYQIRVGIATGWVSSVYITLYGNCQSIGIPPIPPTPTPIITATFVPTNTLTVIPQTATPSATPGLPDLIVTNLTLVGASSLQLGAANTPVTGTFSVTVTNTGQSPTTQFNNVINVNPPGTDNQLGVVASLAPGESIVLNISLTFTAAGTYTIEVRADSDSQITEMSEVNNQALTTITVAPNP